MCQVRMVLPRLLCSRRRSKQSKMRRVSQMRSLKWFHWYKQLCVHICLQTPPLLEMPWQVVLQNLLYGPGFLNHEFSSNLASISSASYLRQVLFQIILTSRFISQFKGETYLSWKVQRYGRPWCLDFIEIVGCVCNFDLISLQVDLLVLVVTLW